jgi:hypothetical protein
LSGERITGRLTEKSGTQEREEGMGESKGYNSEKQGKGQMSRKCKTVWSRKRQSNEDTVKARWGLTKNIIIKKKFERRWRGWERCKDGIRFNKNK